MRTAFTKKFSVLAAVAFALSVPLVATAQWGNPDNRGYGRYNDRELRDSVHRLDSLSKSFERDMDRALDHSRVNGSQREDRINAEARDFRRAVGDLKSHVGNGRDLNRSADVARRVLQEAQQLDRIARPAWFNGALSSEWSQIQYELRTISNAYGFRYSGDRRDDRRYGQSDDWRRNTYPR